MHAKLQQCRDILKSIPPEDAIRLEAMKVFREILTELTRLRPGIERLSPRELQVFEWMGVGKTTKEIAALVGVSTKTVETFRDSARLKLGMESAQRLTYAAFQWMAAKDKEAIQESTSDGHIPRAAPPQHLPAFPSPASPLPSS